VEEVISTLNDLVREGKIRHYGFSDTPAWYVARAQTLAEKEGKERLIALQLEYSLVERNIEREHIPAAQELGLGICPWSPLASGFLTGKYKRQGNDGRGDGRLEKTRDSQNPTLLRFNQKNWEILEILLEVSKQMGRPAAQVALNWVATQPGITSTILGASKLSQLEDNLRSIEFSIPAEFRQKLDQASAPESMHPYVFFEPFIQGMIHGAKVQGWSPSRVLPAERPTQQVEVRGVEKIA
jgi:aryl-alcohol dehydrogenase-like predicted oxidoreductase